MEAYLTFVNGSRSHRTKARKNTQITCSSFCSFHVLACMASVRAYIFNILLKHVLAVSLGLGSTCIWHIFLLRRIPLAIILLSWLRFCGYLFVCIFFALLCQVQRGELIYIFYCMLIYCRRSNKISMQSSVPK